MIKFSKKAIAIVILLTFICTKNAFSQNTEFIRSTINFSVAELPEEYKPLYMKEQNEYILNAFKESKYSTKFNTISGIDNWHKKELIDTKNKPDSILDWRWVKKTHRKRKFEAIVLENRYTTLSKDLQRLYKDMVSKLFEFDGKTFSYDKVLALAKYTASDNLDKVGQKTKVRSRMYFDLSEALLDKVYNVTLIPRHYEVDYKFNGNLKYIGYYDIIVTKLSWSKKESNYFFENCWVDDETLEDDKFIKLRNFQDFNFSHELVYTDNIKRTYMSSSEVPLKSFVNYVFEKVQHELTSNISDFKFSTLLTDVYPTKSKMGNRQGANPCDRYFALEVKEKNNGDIKLNRKGVLRIDTVTNNIKDKSLKSPMQQQGGVKLYPGIVIQEAPSKQNNIITSYRPNFSNNKPNFNQYQLDMYYGPKSNYSGKNENKNRYWGWGLGLSPTLSDVRCLKTDTNTYNAYQYRAKLGISRDRYFTNKGNVFVYSSFDIDVTIIGFNDQSNEPYDPEDMSSRDRDPLLSMIGSNLGLGLGWHIGPLFSILVQPKLSYYFLLDTQDDDTRWTEEEVTFKTLDPMWRNNQLSCNFSLRFHF
ncbi:MAG: hypothetical protein P8I11_02175 [Bacteroidia bacterium]|nr:hypothetical protein [Bacteroidia bacterium]